MILAGVMAEIEKFEREKSLEKKNKKLIHIKTFSFSFFFGYVIFIV